MKPLEVRRTDPFDETLFPLSAAQRATWFAQQFDPEVPILIAHYVELRGELDVELLDRETRAVAYEFQSPMLKVIEVDGQPMQYVDEKAEISVGLVDFRWTEDPFEAALEWMRRDCRSAGILGLWMRRADWSWSRVSRNSPIQLSPCANPR